MLGPTRLAAKGLSLVCLLGISGCVSDPDDAKNSLSDGDVLFKSNNCVAARQAADNYNDHSTERSIAGLALGLALGPVGSAVSLAMDARQYQAGEQLKAVIQSSCVTMEPRTLAVPPKASLTVPLRVESQPSAAIAVITKEPLSALVKNQAEADGVASLGIDNPYWKNKIIIAHCVTPCVVNVPRGAVFYANALKKGHASTGYGKALTWVLSETYGRTLNSDNITFRLVPVAAEAGPQ